MEFARYEIGDPVKTFDDGKTGTVTKVNGRVVTMRFHEDGLSLTCVDVVLRPAPQMPIKPANPVNVGELVAKLGPLKKPSPSPG